MTRILHIDMNSFFVSCELSKYDNIFDTKLVIGGDSVSRQGVITSASYEARKYGINAPMTVSDALKIAPDLIVKGVNFKLYRQISYDLFEFLKSKFDIVEQASIDEAYIDISNIIYKSGNEYNIANKLQKLILNKFNLPCSIGIGDNRLQAKMASNKNKPQKITIVEDNFSELFGDDDISTIHGLGKSSQKVYRKFGINKIIDIQKYGEKNWVKKEWRYEHFLYAQGISTSYVNPHAREIPKSVSNERTLVKDITIEDEVFKEFDNLYEKTYSRLIDYDLVCKTVSVKLKFSNFSQKQKSKSLKIYSDDKILLKNTVYDLVTELTDFEKDIRLISIGFSTFITNSEFRNRYLRYFEPFKEYIDENKNS